jgi:hypothetical protein
MKRYALNTNGTILSLYDGWIDDIVSNPVVDENFITKDERRKTVKCHVVDHSMPRDDPFLEILDIEDELWLSIVLKMNPTSEAIAMSYNNYRLPTDRNVNFLYYYSIHNRCCLFDDHEIVKDILPIVSANPGATHIITDIQYGIDFVIQVEFSLDENPSDIKFH